VAHQREETRSNSTPPAMGRYYLAGLSPALYRATPNTIRLERRTARVKCLAQEHNTMSPVRARTRTALTVQPPRLQQVIKYYNNNNNDDNDDRHDTYLKRNYKT